MTPATEQAIEALGTTPEALKARTEQMDALARGAKPNGGPTSLLDATAPKPNYPLENLVGLLKNPTTRKKRADAGKPRPPKAEQPAGKLSREQVDTLDTLVAARDQAANRYLDAQKAYADFLQEITA